MRRALPERDTTGKDTVMCGDALEDVFCDKHVLIQAEDAEVLNSRQRKCPDAGGSIVSLRTSEAREIQVWLC